MNFLDAFDVARPTTPNPQTTGAGAAATEQPSLNEEVNQVIGQLGRFWGGFRKQSQSALESARKDLGDVVVQAQKELSKLAAPVVVGETSASGSRSAASSAENEVASSTTGGASVAATDNEKTGASAVETNESGTSPRVDSTDPSTTSSDIPSSPSAAPPASTTTTTTLFSRLQSALPPNIVAAVQNNLTALHIPESLESLKHASETSLESLKHASEARLESIKAAAASAGTSASGAAAGIDLAGLRTNLLAELQRVQGVTRAQAEEYAHRSEVLLREAVKEAGEVLRDAVKVVPPEEVEGGSASGGGSGVGGGSGGSGPAAVLWDGTEMWLLPEAPSYSSGLAAASAPATSTTTKETSSNAVKTRAEALLLRLKQDPDIVRHDPEAEEGVRERFLAWKVKEVDALDGAQEGAEWNNKIKEAVEDIRDGAHLRALEDTLVPSEMTKSAFWLRYFFRVYQIRSEEAKRQALLHSSTDNEEDFSWEDEEDDLASPLVKSKPLSRHTPTAGEKVPLRDSLAVPGSADATGSGANSPRRLGSEDSFDLVSGTSSVAGDLHQGTPRAATSGSKTNVKKEDDDDEEGDSDWE